MTTYQRQRGIRRLKDGSPDLEKPATILYENKEFQQYTEDILRPGGLELTGKALDIAAFPAGSRLLDIGCGCGKSVEFLAADCGMEAWGIDISEELISRAKARNSSLNVQVGSAYDLPYTDSFMDGALMECVFTLLEDKPLALEQIRRVLAPGGKLIISDLYIRENARAFARLPMVTCLNGMTSRDGVCEEVAGAGFKLKAWYDETPVYQGFLAGLIMNYGSMSAFWESLLGSCDKVCTVQKNLRDVKIGYYLSVWEKEPAERAMREDNGARERKPGKVIRETASVCPVCLERVSAQKTACGDHIYLEKVCPEHGAFKSLVWEGKPRYQVWLREEENTKPATCDTGTERGCPYDCGLCPQHEQQACCVLIELTQRCNQHCRFCYADAGRQLAEMNLEEINSLYDFLLERSPGRPFNIQLSGGEPTLREDLAEIIRLGKAKGFPYIQVNSNGKLLAADPAYAQNLAAAGLDSVFLQFDGTSDEIYREIRCEALMDIKRQAIRHCGQAGIGVVLVMTVVPGINDGEIGAIVDFLLANLPAVRGIHFQPVSYFGRFPAEPTDKMRYTIPRLLRDLEDQTRGRLRTGNFIPLLTGHSLCSFHGSFLVMPDGQISALSAAPDKSCCSCRQDAIIGARNYIGRKWGKRTEATGCGSNGGGGENDDTNCDGFEMFLRQVHEKGFSITAMAFQDAWNIDLERLQKCRVHVATPTHRLIPFCAYNLTDREGRSLYGRHIIQE